MVRKSVCIKKLFLELFVKFVLIILLQHKYLYSIKSSLKYVYSRKQSQYLYLIPYVSHFLSSYPNLHLILKIPSETLLTRFDKKLAINRALSIDCNM